MLTIENKIFRNLQEQVEANKLSIQAILDEKGVLNQFGIRVIGKVDYVRELPEQDNPVHLEYGDAYAVGTETPYDLFIWTRKMTTTAGDFWFNIGKFPQPSTVPGPQGPQGQPGKDGENSKWYISLTAPSFTAVNNDMCLNVTNGDVYTYEDVWVKKGNIKGSQGIQGPKGDASTVPGPQGPKGPKGDRGANTTWYILGELTSTSQLPDPTTVRRDAAYLVNVGETNHLYAIVGTDTLTWVDVGVVPQVIPGIGQPGTGTNAERFNNYTTNTASGASSHAEGEFTIASGDSSHAEGYENTASGNYSHAEGTSTTAGGESSHAEGNSTLANGVCSHAEGVGTKATGQYQHVQGKYNIEDTESKYAHIIGNGTNSLSDRSNAHTVDWSGNAWYAGKVSGGTVGSPAPVENDNDYVTKKYFDDNAGNAGEYVNTNQVFINKTNCDWELNDVSSNVMTITPIISCVGKIAIHFESNLRGIGLILYILSRTGGKAQQYDVKDVYINEEVYEFEFDDDIRIAIMAPGGIDPYYERIKNGTNIYTLRESALFDYLRQKIIGHKNIYCFGDSLTAGVITGTTTITENYPYWLKKFLKNENIDIRNYGVPGATVQDMYNKISTLDFINCDIAILMIGTNGFITESTDSVSYYNACIESIINNSKGKAKIVIMNPPKSVRDGVPQRWLDEMHYTIEKIANNYGLDCIDLYNFLPFAVTNKTYYSDDGVHLTKNGYYYVAFIIYNYLINNMTASQKGGSPTFDY